MSTSNLSLYKRAKLNPAIKDTVYTECNLECNLYHSSYHFDDQKNHCLAPIYNIIYTKMYVTFSNIVSRMRFFTGIGVHMVLNHCATQFVVSCRVPNRPNRHFLLIDVFKIHLFARWRREDVADNHELLIMEHSRLPGSVYLTNTFSLFQEMVFAAFRESNWAIAKLLSWIMIVTRSLLTKLLVVLLECLWCFTAWLGPHGVIYCQVTPCFWPFALHRARFCSVVMHYLFVTKLVCSLTWFFSSREEPTLIAGLSGKNIVAISCGSSYSAAISAAGELFTWGRGNYGRLGHGK